MPSGIAALLCAGRLFCIALAFCPNLRYAERKAGEALCTMFFNHRKTCAALQPPPGLGPADIATQSSICTGETIIGFRQPGTDRLLQAVVVHSPQDVADFFVLMGFLLRKERIPSRAPFDIVLSISPDIFASNA